MTVAALSSRWRELMEDLKRNRQALTATVFQEGRPVGFGSNVLEIEFPADSDFHAAEARKSRHGDAFVSVLEERLGVRPRLDCRVASGPTGAFTPPKEEGGGEEQLARPRDHAEVGEAPRGASAPARMAPDATGPGDRIRSEDEVFEMARER